MEEFGLIVSFSLYGDLLGISEWAWATQKDCVKSGVCNSSIQKKSEEETADIAKAKVAEVQVKKELVEAKVPVAEVEVEVEEEEEITEPGENDWRI